MCSLHYQRWQLTGDVEVQARGGRICGVPGCGRPHRTRGWCNAHHIQWKRHGDALGGTCHALASPEKRALWERTTPLIRADLRVAMTAWRTKNWLDAKRYVQRAQAHGRGLSRLEQAVVDGVMADYHRSEGVLQTTRRIGEMTRKGLSAAQIGMRLGVSDRTVQRYRSRHREMSQVA